MKKKLVSALLLSLVLSMSLFAWGCGTTEDEEATITIAAAASLQNVLEDEIIPAFNEVHPNITVQGTFDSSGNLQTQIEQGAEIDLFFSAALKQMDALTTGGFVTEGEAVNLLENEIVLVAGSDQDVSNFTKFEDIVNADTIALGDPASVPAGTYAKESLTNLKLWDTVQSKKISLGTNVSQVLGWVSEGSAQVGIVYNTDALSMPDKVQIIGKAPADSVSKCIYPVAVLTATKQATASTIFLDFLQSDEALTIFESFGFKISE
jgi:molybdate transport system substrate-binding protein